MFNIVIFAYLLSYMAFPKLHKDSFELTFQVICTFTYV